MTNVWGDAVGAGVVAHLCESEEDDEGSLGRNSNRDYYLDGMRSVENKGYYYDASSECVAKVQQMNNNQTKSDGCGNEIVKHDYMERTTQQQSTVVRINENYFDELKHNGETSF